MRLGDHFPVDPGSPVIGVADLTCQSKCVSDRQLFQAANYSSKKRGDSYCQWILPPTIWTVLIQIEVFIQFWLHQSLKSLCQCQAKYSGLCDSLGWDCHYHEHHRDCSRKYFDLSASIQEIEFYSHASKNLIYIRTNVDQDNACIFCLRLWHGLNKENLKKKQQNILMCDL